MPTALPRTTTETRSVDELVHLLLGGRIRVPIYQGALRWDAGDVQALFDSIYRGYPIGSLLLHRRAAPAATLRLGPLTIHAPETSQAFDVVDGQQRLIALAAGLARPEPIPTTPEDPYVVYFDLEREDFVSPPKGGRIPDTWIPLPILWESPLLMKWVLARPDGRDPDLHARIFRARSHLIEYRIPLYTFEAEDPAVPRAIFFRINTSGKPLRWEDIHDALYGSPRGRAASPTTLPEMTDALEALGFGRLDEGVVLRCLVASQGRDFTRPYSEHERASPGFLAGVAAGALPTLRRVLGFLRDHAEIVHLRLLPRSAPLPVLARFFHLHPEPGARTLELLTWWLWRGFLCARPPEPALLRQSMVAISGDEEASVQGLLALVPKIDPSTLVVPRRFDLRTVESRVAMLALASLGPRDLATERPIDVARALAEHDLAAFRRILPKGRSAGSPANRILLPGDEPALGALLAYLTAPRRSDVVLRSHALSPAAAENLQGGRIDDFFAERLALLTEATRALATRLSGFGRSDRPSIDYLLRSASP